jgi:hypothetical protein
MGGVGFNMICACDQVWRLRPCVKVIVVDAILSDSRPNCLTVGDI